MDAIDWCISLPPPGGRAGEGNRTRWPRQGDVVADHPCPHGRRCERPRITVIPVASSGGGSIGGCAPTYSQASCLTFTAGTVASHGGRNWTCANANCMNCATHASCAPGASGCPWGTPWTDAGACQ